MTFFMHMRRRCTTASKSLKKKASKINEKGLKNEFGMRYPVEGPLGSHFGPHSGSIWSSFPPRDRFLGARSGPRRVKKGLLNAASTLTDFQRFLPGWPAAGGDAVLPLAGVREPAPIFKKKLLGVESQPLSRGSAPEGPV